MARLGAARALVDAWRRHFPVRLAASTAVVLAVVMLGVLAAVYTAVASLLIRQLDARALAALREPRPGPWREGARGEVRLEGPDERAERLYEEPERDDHREQTWVWSIRRGGEEGPARPVLAWLWPDPGDVRVGRAASGGASLVVVQQLDEVAQTLRGLRWWLAAVGAAGTLAVSGVAFASARRAFAPVHGMMEAAARVAQAQHISPETLSVRVPPSAGDITLERLAELFNAMLARVRDAMAAQARFVDDASHELRTPLGALRAHLEVALKEHGPDSPCRLSLERALGQVERLSRLADGLLALARYERGGLVHPVPGTDVLAAIRQALEDVRHLAEQSEVTLVAELPDVLRATCDRDAVARVVTNLLRNAVEASPPGSLVQVSAGLRDGDRAWIEVADSGPGMTPAEAARAFEPFFRVDRRDPAARTSSGAGLGLAISRAIVEAHGGRIYLDTSPGRGTRVQVVLPSSSGAGTEPGRD